MNLSDIDELKKVLKQSGFSPKDYLGQNFLIDEKALHEILLSAEIQPTDTILEVGPGLGVLTRELVKSAGKVIAVEKDPRLVKFLEHNFSANQNLEIIEGDILKFNVAEKVLGPYKVVANIPYYLTSKLIQNFLEAPHRPTSLTLMIQKEVAERIIAAPGKLSVLAISVQIYASAQIVAMVQKTSFWPTPEVDSAIIKITPNDKHSGINDKKNFFRIVKTAFAGKRKQIHNTIQNKEALTKAGIDAKIRPQDLSIEDWIRLYEALK